MILVLLGAPGSGKGTQAQTLCEARGLVHIATGDLFREHLEHDTELGRTARSYIDRGALVPDQVTVAMLQGRLERLVPGTGVVLDGFPRTIGQADALGEMLDDLDRTLSGVLYLEVRDEVIVERLAGRMICRECQRPFHETFNPFESCPENRCRGEHLYQRDDDKPDTVRTRLATYRKQTEPLIDYYRARDLLIAVPGEGDPDEVGKRLIEATAALEAS